MICALKKDEVPIYKVKMQQQGSDNLSRAKEKRSEPEYKRQLQQMVHSALHLPTLPELRFIIKLQPSLMPAKVPELNQHPQMLYAIRNNKHILENKIIEQATSSQGNAFLKCNAKPAAVGVGSSRPRTRPSWVQLWRTSPRTRPWGRLG